MNDIAPEASIQRFVADLKRIREARDVSLSDIHEATRVSEDVLDDFESGALFKRSSFNPVYLRSLAKSYARHVGITPVQRVLEYLELAQANRYTNELAVDELDEEPLSIAWPDDESADADAEDSSPAALDASAFDDSAADDTDVSSAGGTPARTSPSSGAGQSDAGKPDGRRWSSSSTSASGSATSGRGASRPLVVLGVVLLVIVGGIAWGLVQWSGSDDGPPEPSPAEEEVTSSPQDTVQSDASTEPPAPVLGDTLYATFYAANGSVDGVRVQRDDDLRRPYWIEENTAVVLPFAERIAIERQLDRFQLFINEYPMPLEPLDDAGRFVLTRSDMRAWADTTQATSANNLPLPADTLRIP